MTNQFLLAKPKPGGENARDGDSRKPVDIVNRLQENRFEIMATNEATANPHI